MNEHHHFIKNILSSLTGGTFTFLTLETMFDVLQSVVVGVSVSVLSFLIIHKIQTYWKEKKLSNKHNNTDAHDDLGNYKQ